MRWHGTAILAAITLALFTAAAVSGQDKGEPPNVPIRWKIDKKLYTPADVSRAMAVDAVALSRTVLAEEMYNIRYLSVAGVPAESRGLYHAQISLNVNRLSRRTPIVVPAQVGPDAILARVNLADYDISPKVWDRIAHLSPYFHEQYLESALKVIEVEKTTQIPYTETVEVHRTNAKGEKLYWPDGKPAMDKKQVTKYKSSSATNTTTHESDPVTKLGIASWLDPEAMAVVVRLTQSTTPIVRADWFLANAMLPPLYYDFLELKTLDDAKELALYDKRAEKTSDARATVVLSGDKARAVARNNRILKRVKTAHGMWWETFDFKTSVGKQNVIHNFLTTSRDGGEIIFSLPNGLHAYFLVNEKDERVDEVPIAIATDSLAKDMRVRCGRSCIWCHSKGIQPFTSDFKVEVTPQNLIDLGLTEKGDVKKTLELVRFVREVFGVVDFDAVVRIDNAAYENAVKAATGGRTAPASAAAFLQLYDDFAEVPLDIDRMIYEGGVPDLDVKGAIRLSLNGINNGVLLRQSFNMPLPIRRDQFEESFADYMHRVAAWQAVKNAVGPPVPFPAKEGKP